MSEHLVDLLTKLNVAYKRLRLYPPEHGLASSAVEEALAALRDAVAIEPSLTFGLSGATAVHRGVPLIDLGGRASALLSALAEARVVWIRFTPEVRREQLVQFLLWVGERAAAPEKAKVVPSFGPGLEAGFGEDVEGSGVGFAKAAASVLQAMLISFRAGDVRVPLAELSEIVAAIRAEVMQGHLPLGALELAMGAKEYVVRRAVLTSTLAMGLARRMGLDASLVQRIGEAALTADVALFRVEEALLSQRQGGPSHIPRWSEHPADGARILSSVGASSLAITVAAEHHWGLKYASPARHPGSALVGLADTLVGLLIGGYGMSAHRLDLALVEVASEGTHHPPELVRALLHMSGLFVKGAKVRLSNRQKGEIVTPNPMDPLRPEVLVDTETEGMKLVDLAASPDRVSVVAVVDQ